jgi:hypothetical protein
MYNSTHSLTSALDGGEWSASRPGRFISRERASGTHWIGGWVCPRAGLDAVVKRKIPSPRLESNPRTPIVQPVAQRYTDWAIMALLPLYVVISAWKLNSFFLYSPVFPLSFQHVTLLVPSFRILSSFVSLIISILSPCFSSFLPSLVLFSFLVLLMTFHVACERFHVLVTLCV